MGCSKYVLLFSLVIALVLADDDVEVVTETPLYGMIEGCLVACTGAGHRRHPSDCRKYIRCTEDGPVAMPCPEGTVWDNDKKLCNYEDAVECRVGFFYTADGANCPGACQIECPSENGKFPHPRDCHRYFLCRDGVAEYKTCGRKNHFDVDSSKCVLMGEATCNALPDNKC